MDTTADKCALPSLHDFSRSPTRDVPFSRVRRRIIAHRIPRSPQASRAKPQRKLERLIELERQKNLQEAALRRAALKNSADVRSKFVHQTAASQAKRMYRHDDVRVERKKSARRRLTKPRAPSFMSARRAKLRSDRAESLLATEPDQRTQKPKVVVRTKKRIKPSPPKAAKPRKKLTKPRAPSFATDSRRRAASVQQRAAPTQKIVSNSAPASVSRPRTRSRVETKRVSKSQTATKRTAPRAGNPTRPVAAGGKQPGFMRGTVMSSMKNTRDAALDKKTKSIEKEATKPMPPQRLSRARSRSSTRRPSAAPVFMGPVRRPRSKTRDPARQQQATQQRPLPPLQQPPAQRPRPQPAAAESMQPAQPQPPAQHRPPVVPRERPPAPRPPAPRPPMQPRVRTRRQSLPAPPSTRVVSSRPTRKRRGSQSKFTFADAEIERMLHDGATSVSAADMVVLPSATRTADGMTAKDVIIPGADMATMLCLREKLDKLDSLFIEISEKIDVDAASFEITPSWFIDPRTPTTPIAA